MFYHEFCIHLWYESDEALREYVSMTLIKYRGIANAVAYEASCVVFVARTAGSAGNSRGMGTAASSSSAITEYRELRYSALSPLIRLM
jgi:hypothetical protein